MRCQVLCVTLGKSRRATLTRRSTDVIRCDAITLDAAVFCIKTKNASSKPLFVLDHFDPNFE